MRYEYFMSSKYNTGKTKKLINCPYHLNPLDELRLNHQMYTLLLLCIIPGKIETIVISLTKQKRLF